MTWVFLAIFFYYYIKFGLWLESEGEKNEKNKNSYNSVVSNRVRPSDYRIRGTRPGEYISINPKVAEIIKD